MEWKQIKEKLNKLPEETQTLIDEDMKTAYLNRIKVFEKMAQKN